MKTPFISLIFFAQIAAAAPGLAAERNVTLTDFDRIRVDGGFVVDIRAGTATSAKIIGSQAAIDAASVSVQGRQLTIRRNRSTWGGYPGQVPPSATVRVTVPALSAVWVSGPAKVSVDRMKGPRLAASLEGSGSLDIGTLAADRMDIGAVGSGSVTIAGRVGNLTVTLRGAAGLEAGKLVAADLKLTSETAGNVTIGVRRAANVTVTGAGNVVILGTPACTVRNIGSGAVSCGR